MSYTVLPSDKNSPFLARRFVEQFATEQSLDGAGGALSLIATELVTNAILHGSDPVELTLYDQDGVVTIEVADGDTRVAKIRHGATDHDGRVGRGLHIVASLADRWGVRPTQSGKIVWATVQSRHA